MKHGFVFSLAFGTLLMAGVASASAIVYDNDFGWAVSGDNADVVGYTISGYSVSNSFVLSSSTSLTGVDLLAWKSAGDLAATSLNWYILDNGNPTDPFSGQSGVTTIANGTAAPTDTFLLTNSHGFDVDELSFNISTPVLNSGTTYWLQIDGVTLPNGDLIYWDESDGPSTAWQTDFTDYLAQLPDGNSCNGLCTGSESFQLLAGTAEAPEPGSLALLGGGLIGLAALRRRKRA